MKDKKIKLLLVEDNRVDQMAFEWEVEHEKLPFDYIIADSIQAAKELIKKTKYDVILTDFLLPDGTGMDIIKICTNVPVIVVTGTGGEAIAVQAMKNGAVDYLVKDVNNTHLKIIPAVVENAIKQFETQKQIKLLYHATMNINDAVLITSNHKIIFANDAFYQIYGYAKEEVIEMPEKAFWELISVKVFERTLEPILGECQHKRKNGDHFPVSISNSMLHVEGESFIVYVIRDITHLKEMEKKIIEQTKELVEAKTELQQLELFSFVTTHDFQEPLHKILFFTDLLSRSLESTDLQCKEYLVKIRVAAGKMRMIIEKVFRFSQIGTHGKPFDVVDLTQEAQMALEFYKEILNQIHAVVQVNTLPTVYGDRSQIQQVFQQLIDNAIKFREVERTLEIKIDKKEQVNSKSEMIVFQDNGIGIDPKHIDRIFQPFQRIRLTEEEGVAVGLAMCKKIMLRHGGDIYAESNKSFGTSFYLTFPCK